MTINRHMVVYWFGTLWKEWNIALKHSKYLLICCISIYAIFMPLSSNFTYLFARCQEF
jgi:hypothetical protein